MGHFVPLRLRPFARRLRLVHRAAQLARSAAQDDDPASWWDALRACPGFSAVQIRSEIEGLCGLLQRFEPRVVCEIGGASGGTTFLLARAAHRDATVVSVDQNFTRVSRAAVRRFARGTQRVIGVRGDSHDPRTLARIRAHTHQQPIDVLFIDGDHSYDGVRLDLDMYGPCVRPGGVIVFHDIIADHLHRYGTKTKANSGEVHRLWSEIRASGADVLELVEDPEQDGCGLGLLWWSGARM